MLEYPMDVILDHETHTYTNIHTNEKYTSVTNFISQYKKPFDADFWSKKVAKREGVDQQTVLDTWKNLTVSAQGKGTKIHLAMERFLKEKYVEPGFEDLTDSFFKKTTSIISNTTVVNSEYLVYNHDSKLAGTADIILDNGNTFHVLDFKTNKKFNFSSKYNEYFYEPIEHLQQCEFTTYSIQLSIYAYMYELLTGKKCSSLKIFYLRDFSGKYWQEINCLYMKDTVINMLKNKQQKQLETIII